MKVVLVTKITYPFVHWDLAVEPGAENNPDGQARHPIPPITSEYVLAGPRTT